VTTSPAPLRFKVGALEIVRVLEMEFSLPPSLLAIGRNPSELVAESGWADPHFVSGDSGNVIFALTAHGIVSDGRRILIDPCCSFDLRRGNPDIGGLAATMLDEKLPKAGFAPADVDLVINSHIDGVGWNVRPGAAGWHRSFPKAQSMWTTVELDRVLQDETTEPGATSDKTSLQPLVDAGAIESVPMDHSVTSEISFRPSPGHTPGNVDIWIESGNESAVLVGDNLVNPLQCADPEFTDLDFASDASPKLRRALLEECVERNTLMIGPHFGTPGAGRVRRAGDVWMLEAERVS
jgi:glyoxylase-like metal-dependent hydrolase (beta-lactamase superfamily II)